MLRFDSVTKKYGNFLALDKVDTEIKSGEFVYLTGPSGAGKTTLLRLILKEEDPDSGKIIIDEKDVSKISKKELPYIRRKVGFIFQDFKLLDTRNAFDNIAIALEVVGKNDNQIKKIVPDLLKTVGLADKESNFPWQLSGGEKQRLAIARAVAQEPKIIVADEPTGNLDQATTWEIINLLKQINEQNGTTIILATHNFTLIDNMKKRIISLEKGRLVKDD
jgi:cell division transport system ATP-binding protein